MVPLRSMACKLAVSECCTQESRRLDHDMASGQPPPSPLRSSKNRMKPVRPVLIAVLSLATLASGCGAQTDPGLVVSSDAELGAMATELLPDLARRSGMELRAPVRLEARSRQQLADYLTAKLDDDLPPDEAAARVEAYALLGLVPEDLDLRELLLSLYGEQVAGFYEPDSTALYVLDDQPPEALQALLVHELVHAVQDQSIDLRSLSDPAGGNDRATAAMAAIEGHATLVMFEYLTEQMTGAPVDLGTIPDFAGQVGPALESMSAQFPALAGAPRVIRESLIFPYVDGATFVQRLWTGDVRVDPFGDALPLSTEQVLSPGAAPPLQLRIDVEGARRRLDDTLGQLELRILVEDVLGLDAGGADEVVSGWDGDRWVLSERDDGETSLSYVVAWESEGARNRFVAVVRAAQSAFGGPLEIVEVDVGGRPASLLTVGASGILVTASVEAGG